MIGISSYDAFVLGKELSLKLQRHYNNEWFLLPHCTFHCLECGRWRSFCPFILFFHFSDSWFLHSGTRRYKVWCFYLQNILFPLCTFPSMECRTSICFLIYSYENLADLNVQQYKTLLFLFCIIIYLIYFLQNKVDSTKKINKCLK